VCFGAGWAEGPCNAPNTADERRHQPLEGCAVALLGELDEASIVQQRRTHGLDHSMTELLTQSSRCAFERRAAGLPMTGYYWGFSLWQEADLFRLAGSGNSLSRLASCALPPTFGGREPKHSCKEHTK